MVMDNEISRARKAKRRKIRRKRALAALLVVFLIFAVMTAISISSTVLSYDIRDFFSSLVTFGSFPVETDNGIINEISVSARSMFLLSDTALKVVSGAGAELLEYSHGLSNPGLAVSGSRAAVYSRGGKSFKLFNRTMMLYSGTLQNTIISAAVTQSGKSAFLTSSDVYTCELTVFNRNCEKTFTWYGSDGFPVGVYASSYGNDVLVLCVKSRDGVLYTSVTRIDLNSRKEKESFEVKGLAVKAFPESDSAVIVMDDRCIRCTADGTQEASFSFEGRTVLDVFNDPGRDIVIAFGDNKRSEINSVTVLTRKLSVTGTIDYRDQIEDLWVSSDRVFILTRGTVSSYAHSGILQEIYHCDFSSYSIVYFGGVITLEPKYLIKLSRENREVIEEK
ncbi:MAG: hypothetical protein J5744_00470 [Oscillospiraceae bacterium]|nr:hypothetical protein [Oscillospiraceae bacterium]